ncbi:MAG: PilZ domain-containing protein [Polyangiaceae bacterium]|nr:PilZ domain-containing protein [Polyangiaceae bacterium]
MSAQADDRRSDGGQRIPFEALVVVDERGDATYECEAVDVSENGLHLRTAYLPELGKELTFRFDVGAGEIVAEGAVVWRDEQAKGGEFGVRFSHLDDRSLAALREMCGVDASGAPADAGPAERGARVKLHIEGLASPMRARVRDAQRSEVMVGSNLDFLKVGRSIDLEDVEAGKKRLATIDRVDVEVDKETKVPQLVVTLRYDDAPGADAPAAATKKESPAAKAARADADDAPLDDDKPSAIDALVDRARGVAATLGPRLASMSSSTKAALQGLVDKAKQRRSEAADDKPPTKRVTSPPPAGARFASGKTRTDKDTTMNDDIDLEETDAAKDKQTKRAKIFAASAAGFLVIMLAVFGLRSRSAPPGADAQAAADASAALPPSPAPVAALPAASGDSITANVPLFGPTPMSTTEAAAPPADATAAAAPPAGEPGGDEKAEPGETTYGNGTVSNPKVARLKFDSPLTELKGSTDKHRVIVFVPGHRNIEPASPLAKRDKRLASVKAVPRDGGVEVTYTFKGDPPPFEAKIDGKLLVMEMGEADEATAHKGGKKKNKAVAKAEKKAKKAKKKAKKAKKADD